MTMKTRPSQSTQPARALERPHEAGVFDDMLKKLCPYHKTPVVKPRIFIEKSESLYHRDSPWISGYRTQNVSQINTQSHTSHHIKLIVHEFITSPLWSTSIQASWLNQSENSTQRKLSSQKGLHLYSSRHRQTRAKRRIPQSYHPSALQSNSDSYPAHPKSIPKEWDMSTSPTVCSFKWPNI
jgi:hypothetical protein